ncbi:uncharacterized protein LOC143916314 [Arctopsyche grandis]|uniref:uncharacterized protein LOC143916314 n=1 Tax=Arctopsyche grandis TaxID=121162 RepID=UPI00406D98BF
MKTSHMQVCQLPDGAPELVAERMRVAAGDTLKARCTAPPSYPPANLTWFLNGNSMNSTTTEVLPEVDDFHNGGPKHPVTTTTTSTQAPYYYYEPGANGTSYIWNNRGHDSIWLPEVKIPEEPTTKRRRMSTLTMVVNQESLRQGTLSLTCKASVYSLYSAQAELLLAAERPQIAPVVVLATGHTHSGAASTTTVANGCLAIVLSTIFSKTAIR